MTSTVAGSNASAKARADQARFRSEFRPVGQPPLPDRPGQPSDGTGATVTTIYSASAPVDLTKADRPVPTPADELEAVPSEEPAVDEPPAQPAEAPVGPKPQSPRPIIIVYADTNLSATDRILVTDDPWKCIEQLAISAAVGQPVTEFFLWTEANDENDPVLDYVCDRWAESLSQVVQAVTLVSSTGPASDIFTRLWNAGCREVLLETIPTIADNPFHN